MNDNFKNQLAAFARDVKAICGEQSCCSACPLSLGEPPSCCANYTHFNPDIVIAAVEGFYARDYSDRSSAAVRVLSAKRFVLESHKEDEG